jgi:aspartate/methionine/tyrosine aminotransferase
MGFKVWSGDGAPYHWIELPNNISADEFNNKLFSKGASVLAGICSGMGTKDENKELESFFRFSFGPLEEESFEDDCRILQEALDECLEKI